MLTQDEWRAEAVRRFGADPMKWRFVCPSCKHEAAVEDWKNAGAGEGEVAFSCVGRHSGKAINKNTFMGNGGPCNYAGGGLFRLNPVSVDGHDNVFAFAEPLAQALRLQSAEQPK